MKRRLLIGILCFLPVQFLGFCFLKMGYDMFPEILWIFLVVNVFQLVMSVLHLVDYILTGRVISLGELLK